MSKHSKKAKGFLKDARYSEWHDATFWAVREKRDGMAHGLPEWEQLREKASQIKLHTLSHLDQYLEQFAADMLKDENQTRALYERCVENKLFDALKGVVKLETKTISYEDFVKLH